MGMRWRSLLDSKASSRLDFFRSQANSMGRKLRGLLERARRTLAGSISQVCTETVRDALGPVASSSFRGIPSWLRRGSSKLTGSSSGGCREVTVIHLRSASAAFGFSGVSGLFGGLGRAALNR